VREEEGPQKRRSGDRRQKERMPPSSVYLIDLLGNPLADDLGRGERKTLGPAKHGAATSGGDRIRIVAIEKESLPYPSISWSKERRGGERTEGKSHFTF